MENTEETGGNSAAIFVQDFLRLHRLVCEMAPKVSMFSETMERASLGEKDEQDVCMELYRAKASLATALGSLHIMESILRGPAATDEYRQYLLGVLRSFSLAAVVFADNLSANHVRRQAAPPPQ